MPWSWVSGQSGPLVRPTSTMHFMQAGLANMRGTGENFPPGSDMIGQILNEPQAAERMEFELFGRLLAYTWNHAVSLNYFKIVWLGE